jgi:hypothetical protein
LQGHYFKRPFPIGKRPIGYSCALVRGRLLCERRRLHRHVVEVGTKFEAPKARDDVARMWWYDPAEVLLVRPLGPTAESRLHQLGSGVGRNPLVTGVSHRCDSRCSSNAIPMTSARPRVERRRF